MLLRLGPDKPAERHAVMAERATRRALVWLASLGIPILLVLAVALIWGADLLIPIEKARAGASLGRPVTIVHLHIAPGRIVRVTADDVVVGNPPNWRGEPFARFAHLTVEADAWIYIWHRQLVIPLVALDPLLVVATQTATGDANYTLQLAGPDMQLLEKLVGLPFPRMPH
jgi:hypothetical protein